MERGQSGLVARVAGRSAGRVGSAGAAILALVLTVSGCRDAPPGPDQPDARSAAPPATAARDNVPEPTDAATGVAVPPQAEEAGPRLALNPRRAHIRVFPPDHWNLRFYDRPDLSGRPALELTDDGLRVDGRLACTWPGDRWDKSHEFNMVLGYRTLAVREYDPCMPEDLPLISTWGDGGHGAAALFIEVVARRGAIVESQWGARRLYLDLDTLPGDPREPLEGATLRVKGVLGWEWLLSAEEERQRIEAAYAELLRQADFRQFVEGARGCFESTAAPRCLAPFVASPFYHVDAAAALGTDHYVTAAELVEYLWTARGESGGTGLAWEDVRSCLTAGEPVAIWSDFVQLSGAVLCTLERGHAGWKLTAFHVGC